MESADVLAAGWEKIAGSHARKVMNYLCCCNEICKYDTFIRLQGPLARIAPTNATATTTLLAIPWTEDANANLDTREHVARSSVLRVTSAKTATERANAKTTISCVIQRRDASADPGSTDRNATFPLVDPARAVPAELGRPQWHPDRDPAIPTTAL